MEIPYRSAITVVLSAGLSGWRSPQAGLAAPFSSDLIQDEPIPGLAAHPHIIYKNTHQIGYYFYTVSLLLLPALVLHLVYLLLQLLLVRQVETLHRLETAVQLVH